MIRKFLKIISSCFEYKKPISVIYKGKQYPVIDRIGKYYILKSKQGNIKCRKKDCFIVAYKNKI